jgi:type I restriction enzyme S subunit
MSVGIKLTDFGEIPVSWDIKQINEVTTYVDYRGKTPPKVDSGILLITARNIKMGKIDYDVSREYIPSELYETVMSRGTPKLGDVLITTEAPLGNIASIDKENIALAQRVIKYRGKNGVLDNSYLKYFMLGPIFQNMLNKKSSGSTVKGIKGSILHKLNLILPPLPEQQKIAEILSTVDAKIEVIDQQITETQALKKGLMQRLLTKGIGHTEFKDSPLGEIPKSWEVVELVNHIKLLSGFAFKSDGFNEEGRGIKLLRGINITIGKLRWNEKLDRWWDLPFEEIEKYSAQVGDLVISMDGSLVGRNYARVKDEDLPLLIVQRVACLRAKATLDLEFLNQIIGGPLWLNYVDAVKTSSGIPHISAKNIREFKIPFPSLQEQKQISEILATISDKLELLSEKKTHYQELKQGLMQQLLTGKLRVPQLPNENETSAC